MKIIKLIEQETTTRAQSYYGFVTLFRAITTIVGIDLNRLDAFILNSQEIGASNFAAYLEARNYELDPETCLNRILKVQDDKYLFNFIQHIQKHRGIDLVPLVLSKVDFKAFNNLHLSYLIRQLKIENYPFSDNIIDKLIDLKYSDVYQIGNVITILNKILNKDIKFASRICQEYLYQTSRESETISKEFLDIYTKIIISLQNPFAAKNFLENVPIIRDLIFQLFKILLKNMELQVYY